MLTDDLTTDDPHEVTYAMIRSFVELRKAAGLTADLTDLGEVMPLAEAGG